MLIVDFEVNVEEMLLPPLVDELLVFEELVTVTNGGGLGEVTLPPELLTFELETDTRGGGGLVGGVILSLRPDDDTTESLLLEDDRTELTAEAVGCSLGDLLDDAGAEPPAKDAPCTCGLGDLLEGSDDFFGKRAPLELPWVTVS